MGQMIRLGCGCGYQSDELFLGSGMIEAPERVAAHCRRCRAIVGVVAGQRLRCPKCRRKPLILEPSPTEPRESASPVAYVCPTCGKPELQVSSVGMWD